MKLTKFQNDRLTSNVGAATGEICHYCAVLGIDIAIEGKIFGYVTFISVVPALKGSNGTHMGSALNS